VWKLAPNGDERVCAIGAGQAQIHESDVRAMAPEFRQSLLGIGCLGDQEHIWLRTEDSTQSFTKNRMVFDAQDANGVGLGHRNSLDRQLYRWLDGVKDFRADVIRDRETRNGHAPALDPFQDRDGWQTASLQRFGRRNTDGASAADR